MKRNFDRTPALLVCALGLLSAWNLAIGQVNISGPRTITMSPGETRTLRYSIVNRNEEQVQARVFFNDYAQMPDGTLVHVPAETLPQSLFRVAEFKLLEFVLSPGGSAEVSLTVALPQDALGGYWGVIGVETPPPPTPEGEQGVSFNIRYAMVTALEVDGLVRHAVSIDNIASTQSDSGSAVVLTMRNAGSSYERYDLSVTFESADGKSTTTTSKSVILPGLTVDLAVPVPDSLPAGVYGVFAELTFEEGMRAEAVGVITVEE